MKNFASIILAVVLSVTTLPAQTIEETLSSVERNNTTLKALREASDARILGNRTELLFEDPEVDFNYLWGSPSSIGKRQDVAVRQTFDFSTISGLKGKVADRKNSLVELRYKADRMNLLLEAEGYCLEIIYYNSLLDEYETRLENAKALADAQNKRLESGDGNMPDLNNAQLNLANVNADMLRLSTERKGVISQLQRLNGGEAVNLDQSEFPEVRMPADFPLWYADAEGKNPLLSYISQEVELGKAEVSLAKAGRLPSLSVGYMSEKVVGEHFQGISMGISLPLWSSRNKVRQAKTAAAAAEARSTDAKIQCLSELRILYDRAAGLKAVAENYRSSLEKSNNGVLLMKSLNAGSISMSDYIIGTTLYYDTFDKALQAELDYRKALAELSAVEL